MFYVVRDTNYPSRTKRESIETHESMDDAYRSLGQHAVTLHRQGFTVAWWPGRPVFVATAPDGNSSVDMYVREA